MPLRHVHLYNTTGQLSKGREQHLMKKMPAKRIAMCAQRDNTGHPWKDGVQDHLALMKKSVGNVKFPSLLCLDIRCNVYR